MKNTPNFTKPIHPPKNTPITGFSKSPNKGIKSMVKNPFLRNTESPFEKSHKKTSLSEIRPKNESPFAKIKEHQTKDLEELASNSRKNTWFPEGLPDSVKRSPNKNR